MKKHTRLMLLFGIVLCHASLSRASDNDNGSWGPAKLIPAMISFLKTAATTAVTNVIINEGLESWKRTKKSSENFWDYFTASKPKLNTITHDQLKLRPDLNIDTLASLPEEVQSVINKETTSETGEHQMMILYGKPGTGKTTIIQQIALQTGGNYYHVHQDMLDKYSDPTVARFIRIYVELISDETKDGTISTLHLEEFGKQFGISADNQIHNMQHGMYENTWKSLLQDLEKKYPKVRVIACSNYGQDGKQFNAAIANERAHVIHIGAPNEIARKVFLTTTCAAHVEKQGIKHAQYQTKSIKYQTDRNKILTTDYLVTPEMHNLSSNEHEKKIKMIAPGSIHDYIWPSHWVETWNKHVEAQKIKSNGYVTPVVNCDLSKATEEQITKFVSLTDALRYRQLNEITEDARIDQLAQIKRMKKHLANPTSKYSVDTANRTFSLLTTIDDPEHQGAEIKATITAPFGQIKPHNIVEAAANRRNQFLHELKKDKPELTSEVNKELNKMPVTDIRSMAKKYEQRQYITALKYQQNMKQHPEAIAGSEKVN